ncbi:hypothetical protein MYX82_12765 [Acidobacteria bacterium AH-259-D05]|nr:hypothetical protein [Acidobacteria bacterium AH-259-D05]
MSLKLVPLFPEGPLVPYSDLAQIGEIIGVKHVKYPFLNNFYSPQLVQDGVQKLDVKDEQPGASNDGKAFEYCYLNNYGVYLYKRDIGMLEQGGQGRKEISFRRFPYFVHQYVTSAIQYHKHIGFFGTLQLKVELKNTLGVTIVHPGVANMPTEDKGDMQWQITSNDLSWQRVVSLAELEDMKIDFVTSLLHEIAMSLGIQHWDHDKIKPSLEQFQ